MGADVAVPHLRFTDRCAMRWRLARAWRTGMKERRAGVLGRAQAYQGTRLEGVHRQPGEPVAEAELYFADGATMRIGRSHCPTFDRLARALLEGTVTLDRVADHRRFFGLYFLTARGPVALLVNQIALGVDGGGLRRPTPAPALT